MMEVAISETSVTADNTVHIPENGYFQILFGPMNFILMRFSGSEMLVNTRLVFDVLTSFQFLWTFNREVITEGIGLLK
jgi:hypothetical protein